MNITNLKGKSSIELTLKGASFSQASWNVVAKLKDN